ncbi:MAG: hypothetical protein ABI605_10815 [Rhizobacter sp.]
MSGPDFLAAAATLFNAFTFERLIPLAMLFSMSLLFIWVLFKAQKRDDFDASMFLRNDRGVLAPERLWGFVCFMTHTWAYASLVLSGKAADRDTLIYGGLWSGTAVAFQVLETWRGVRTNTPPLPNPSNPMTTEPPEGRP